MTDIVLSLMAERDALKAQLEEANNLIANLTEQRDTYVNMANLEAKSEPVAWLLPEETVNSLVVDSIERLIKLCKAAHTADIKVRVNGEDRWFEADWL